MLQILKNILTRQTHKPSPYSFDSNIHTFSEFLQKANDYFDANPGEKEQFKQELEYLNTALGSFTEQEKLVYGVVPYPFALQYDYRQVEPVYDEAFMRYYVMFQGKRLYFNDAFNTRESVQRAYTYFTGKQDSRSPLCCLDDSFNVSTYDTVIDYAAGAGHFALSIVDRVKRIILIEPDDIWKNCLIKTFEPFADKVTILHKSFATHDSESTISLQTIVEQYDPQFIKMDGEFGGASFFRHNAALLRERKMKLCVATYRGTDDANLLPELLKEAGYETRFNPGYLLFLFAPLEPPYFRKALVKAWK